MIARLARRVHFSCAHRYFSDQLSEEQNRRIFGSCYSPFGHGHNYILEGFFEGPIDPVTGMICNLAEIDKWLKDVTDPLDHHHLNFDVPAFAKQVPTTENVARFLFEQLDELLKTQPTPHPPRPYRLYKVRLYESEDLWVDYGDRSMRHEE
jgi:6-pyruvoyltetrahydropterin/6-carboxytetrahydropterin synthase